MLTRVWIQAKEDIPSNKWPCFKSTLLCEGFQAFFFLKKTSSEIQEGNVFTKNIYEQMGNFKRFPKKTNFQKPLNPLLLGKQILYKDSGPSAIPKDLSGVVAKLAQWLTEGLPVFVCS